MSASVWNVSLWCVLVCVWSACGVGVCVWCGVCVWSVCVYSMGSLGGCEVYVYSGIAKQIIQNNFSIDA